MSQTKEKRGTENTAIESDKDPYSLNALHLLFGACVGVAALGVFYLSPYVTGQSAIMLAIFNLVFVLLIFPLRGGLHKKLFILLLGNALGIIWNVLFTHLTELVLTALGGAFSFLSLIFGPLLNVLWMVSYWSVGITFLSKPTDRESR